jgi:hypothetical protein
MARRKSKPKLTVKGARLGSKGKPYGYRLGENRARPEQANPGPETPKRRVKNIPKKSP